MPRSLASCPPGTDPIARWLEHLRVERGYSPRTLSAYERELAILANQCAQASALAHFDDAALRRLLAQSVRDGLSARSIARRLSAWRGFFDWFARHGGPLANPARALKAPRLRQRLPNALPPDAAAGVLDAPLGAATAGDAQADFCQQRDQAIAELFYSCGLRLSELTTLDWCWHQHAGQRAKGWISLDEREVTVLGKGNKTRTVPIGDHALAALRAWLAARAQFVQQHPTSDAYALFLSARGTRLAARSVQARITALGQRRGAPVRLHPHLWRHSFASHLLQSSGDLRGVQELLGHADITTTQVYTKLDFQRLAAVYDAAHPRARRRAARSDPSAA